MKQYIDKAVIKAELERIEHETNYEPFTDEVLGKRFVCRSLLSFLNTLEVKEPNIDTQIELIANSIMIPVQANLYHTNIYNFEKRCFKHSDLKEAAKKGFELGLKVKEE